MKNRGFEVVDEKHIKIKEVKTQLPFHGSSSSAGYDLFSKENVVIKSGEKYRFTTDIKAYMRPDEVLKIYVRSSIGMKKGLVLTNTVAIIDADYYNNPSNDGNMMVELLNTSPESQSIEIGERIAQGVFVKKLDADTGTFQRPENYDRTGGIGSSNDKK